MFHGEFPRLALVLRPVKPKAIETKDVAIASQLRKVACFSPLQYNTSN